MSSAAGTLHERITSGQTRAGVAGLGYVGVRLAVEPGRALLARADRAEMAQAG